MRCLIRDNRIFQNTPLKLQVEKGTLKETRSILVAHGSVRQLTNEPKFLFRLPHNPEGHP